MIVMSNEKRSLFKITFGLGNFASALLSWTINHSIGYCILHGLCGWYYVVWYVVKYKLQGL